MAKSSTEPKPIIIQDFQKGVADSPHVGFSMMQNLDVDTVPGVARINFMTAKQTATTVVGKPYWFAYDYVSQVMYMEDDGGIIYGAISPFTSWSVVAGNTTGDSNNGLVYAHDYLFSMRTSAMDVYGPLSGSPSWTNGWSGSPGLSGGLKAAILGRDDILYIANGAQVASLQFNGTFNPSSSGTYSWNSNALQLPLGFKISCFEELGVQLLIGTYKGAQSYSGYKGADIFQWDRSSTSFGVINRIHVNEFGINKMVNINNTVYFTAGTTGAIYTTNGSSTSLLRELYKPMQVTSTLQAVDGPVTIDATADAYAHSMIAHKGKLYIGVSGVNIGVGPQGVWSLDLKSGALKFEHQISTGNSIPSARIYIGCLASVGQENYLIGWYDNGASAQGIDLVGVNNYRYPSYAAYVDSQLYSVGNNLEPRTFSNIMVDLVKPLTTGQGVRVSYRKNLSDSFTVLATFDFTTYNGVNNLTSFSAPAVISAADFVQIRAEFTTGASSATTPELRSITLN